MRIQRRGGALMFLLVVLVACGGSKSTASPTSPSNPAVFSTTNPPLPTTLAAATVPSTAAASSTSAPPATATPTTARPFIPIKDQVAEAVVKHGRLEVACFTAPTSCNLAAITASEGPLRANLTKGVQALIDKRYVAREDPADQRYNTVSEVVVADDDRSAVVTACAWDPVFIWHVGGAPDGTDILINSEKASINRRYVVFLEAGEWRIGDAAPTSEVSGQNVCGPRRA